MSDLKEIKKRLNINSIERILTAIDCEFIREEQGGSLIVAQLPPQFNSNNKRSVQVRMNEQKSCRIRTRPDFQRGDIFSLVSYIHHNKRSEEISKDLPNSKAFICELLGWKEYLEKNKKHKSYVDYTERMKAILRGKQKRRDVKPNAVLPDSIMNQFFYQKSPLPYGKWIEEGISYWTQVIYEVGFDLETKRVVFPIKNRFGQIVGVKGRIVVDEDDPERKYMYIYKCLNSIELFNYHIALPYIKEQKIVYVFESEKSSMICFSNGIYNTVAIGASDISVEQADMIKQTGIDTKIVLCYDKGISIDAIKKQADVFEGREVYAIFDKDGLLEDKDSPVDRGMDVWKQLCEKNIYKVRQKNVKALDESKK